MPQSIKNQLKKAAKGHQKMTKFLSPRPPPPPQKENEDGLDWSNKPGHSDSADFKEARLNLKRKIDVASSYSEEDTDDKDRNALDWSNGPGPSTSSITRENDFPDHPEYGKLSEYKKLHDIRVALLDWLKDKSKNAHLYKTDKKIKNLRKELEEKLKEAIVMQKNVDDQSDILWSSVSMNGRSDGVKGFYRIMGKKRPRTIYLHQTLATCMKITDAKIKYRERMKDPEDPVHLKYVSLAKSRAAFPKLDILYTVACISPTCMESSLVDTISSLELVQRDLTSQIKDAEYEIYTGMHGGDNRGSTSMRPGHFRSSSEIYSRTKAAEGDKKKCVVQIFSRMCASKDTRMFAEAFLLRYQEKWNKKYGTNKYIITQAASALTDELSDLAQLYVDKGTKLFELVQSSDQTKPPLRKYCTLADLTDLPYRISAEELILQFDPRDPDLVPSWEPMKDLKTLLTVYPGPIPPKFWDDKEDMKTQYDALVKQVASPLSSGPTTTVSIASVHIVHSPQPNSPALLRSPLVQASPATSPYTIDDDLMDEALIGGNSK